MCCDGIPNSVNDKALVGGNFVKSISRMAMYTVKLKFEQKGVEPVTFENVEPGQTILDLALKNDIDLHHNCGGVCACTTCHVYIEKGMDHIDEISDKEEDFIDRAVNPKLNS